MGTMVIPVTSVYVKNVAKAVRITLVEEGEM